LAITQAALRFCRFQTVRRALLAAANLGQRIHRGGRSIPGRWYGPCERLGDAALFGAPVSARPWLPRRCCTSICEFLDLKPTITDPPNPVSAPRTLQQGIEFRNVAFRYPGSEWFDKLRQLTTGRTAMVVTHRFTIAMRADLIYVMEGGKVVESGSHQSLRRSCGLYAESWREQVLAGSARSEEDQDIAELDCTSPALARGSGYS